MTDVKAVNVKRRAGRCSPHTNGFANAAALYNAALYSVVQQLSCKCLVVHDKKLCMCLAVVLAAPLQS
jgi:hypothetical protein